MPNVKKSRLKTEKPVLEPMLLHVVSDSTGNLAGHMVTAFLTQFAPGTFDVRPWNFVSTDERLHRTLAQIATVGGVVMHAMVTPKHKKAVVDFCAAAGIDCCDLTGRFVEFLSAAAGIDASQNVKALHEVSDEYRKRIEAIEFMIQHDDGLGADRLREADVILVGVSRTSKTPTCIYLAQQGYKAANVAIAIEAPLPEQLLAVKERKIVGLLIDPWRLVEVRQSRQSSWNMNATSYVDPDHVQREVTWSRKLFMRQGWPTLDVTKTAVEETAAKVIDVLKLRPVKVGE